MAGPVKWTPTSADASHIKFEGEQPHYIMQEGNTPHHVAIMINQMHPELGDVATIRENIVKYNGFDTDPKHKTDPSYNEKSVYRLQIGQEIGLPTEYATALAEFNTAHPADAVTMGGDVSAPEAPVEAAAPPEAAPAPNAKQAAADLDAVVGGGAETAAPQEKKGLWATTIGGRIAGSGLFRRDPEKVEARQAARAERQEEREHRVAERQAEHESKVAARQQAHDEKVAERQEARTERQGEREQRVAERQAEHESKVAARQQAHDEKVADRQEKHDARVAEKIAKDTEKQRAAETEARSQQDALAGYKTTLAGQPKYAEVVAYIEQHGGHRPGKVLAKAEDMVAAIDQREARNDKREAIAALRGTIKDVRQDEVTPQAALDGVATIYEADEPVLVAEGEPSAE